LSDLPVLKISPECVTIPEQQGKFSGRIADFSLWTVMFWIAFAPFVMKQLYRSDLGAITSFVGTGFTTRRVEAIELHITTPYAPYTGQQVAQLQDS
jgi:hypothetical protein